MNLPAMSLAAMNVPMYPVLTLVAMAGAVLVDIYLTRSRVVVTARFWVSFAIMVFFQVFVDGWLTRAQGTIVNYDEQQLSGIRVFFHTPIEDFGFGFALILITISVWVRLGRRTREEVT